TGRAIPKSAESVHRSRLRVRREALRRTRDFARAFRTLRPATAGRSQISVGDGAEMGGVDEGRVFGEDTASVTRFGLFPGFGARFQFRGGNAERDRAVFGVDGDRVAVFHE